MKFIELLRLIKPLKREDKKAIDESSLSLEKEDISRIVPLIKQKKVSFVESSLNVSKNLLPSKSFYSLVSNSTEEEIVNYVERLNNKILKNHKERHIKIFSKNAMENISKFIGKNIEGFPIIKKAIALQLFAIDRIHILLLGDPGTGKTDMLRDATGLHPISTFGLGSGTTGAGLTITTKGKEVSKGLLPMADGGICAIDELNLMEHKERASLYNAMEKGFVTYDKSGKHYRFEANVRVLATANPKGDKFRARSVGELKKQLPFDPALISRFHLVFLIRKPNVEEFRKITSKILKNNNKVNKGDIEFIKDYINYAENIEVSLPRKFEKQIEDFVESIKIAEDKYLVEVSPRIVIGFVRMAKASARVKLKNKVEQEDIDLVIKIVNEGLKTE